jgi:hypothetical protein
MPVLLTACDGLVVLFSAYRGHPKVRGSCKLSALRLPGNDSIDMPARNRVGGAWLQGALTCRAFHRHRP